MSVDTSNPVFRQRIKSYFNRPEVRGFSFLPDRVQVKLKPGSPRINIPAFEGITIEYVYEDIRPAF